MSARFAEWIGGLRPDALLLETAVQGVVVLALALAVFRLWRRASAAWRHFGFTVALTGTLALPLLRPFTPAMGMPASIASGVAGGSTSSALDTQASATAEHPDRLTSPPTLGADDAVPRSPQQAADLRAPVSQWPMRQHAPPAIPSEPSEGSWTTLPRGRALFLTWVGGLLAVLLPMALGTLRLRTWAHRTSGRLGAAWSATRDTLAATRPELSRIRLLETAAGSMPMTWGIWRPTIALPADGEAWPEGRRRDVLLHELAHVTRRDCLTQSLGRLACAVRWYDPLAWIALRCMRLERERACDDLVISGGREAAEYAASLVAIARQAGGRRAAAFAGLAMARRSTLHARVGSLLARGHNRSALTVRHAVATALGIAAVLASASSLRARPAADAAAVFAGISWERPLPVETDSVESERASRATPPDPVTASPTRWGAQSNPPANRPVVCDTSATRGRRGSRTNHSISSSRSGERVWQVLWSSNGCALLIQARGDVEWTDDLTDVRSVTDGGSITIESDDGRTVRRYVVRSRNGALERAYSVDDTPRPFDAEGRAWLGETLVSLDRRTGFAADIRLPRILQRDGVEGALREIELVEGDYAQRIYYTKLLSLRDLTARELQRALSATAQSIESDYEMAELLSAFAKERAFDAGAYPGYVRALGTIGSAYELRRAATVILARDDLPPDAARGILQAAGAIDSDYEKAQLLVTMGRRYALDGATRPIYVEALRSIQGAYERRRVMDVILSGAALDSATLRTLVAATLDMHADYEVTEVLLKLARQGAATIAMNDFFAVTRGIRSDYEKARVLSATAGRDDLTPAALRELLAVAGTIGSDYECAQVLVAVARQHTLDEEARRAYERAAETIDSEHEYGRALSALRRAR